MTLDVTLGSRPSFDNKGIALKWGEKALSKTNGFPSFPTIGFPLWEDYS